MQKSFLNNVVFTLVGKGFELVLVYVIQILLTKFLPVSDFGVYSKWLITINYAALILSFGLNNSILFFSAAQKINIWTSLLINMSIYIIFSFLLYLLLPFYDFGLFETNCFIYYTFFSLVFSTCVSIPIIYDDFLVYNIINLLRRVVSLFFLSLIFLHLTMANAISVVKLDTLSLVFLTILVFIWIILFVKKRERFKISLSYGAFVNYFNYGIKSISLNFLGLSVYSLDIFIVSYFLDSTSLAYYVIAGTIIKITWFIVDNVGTVVFPRFIKENNRERSLEVINSIIQLSFLLSLVFTIIFTFIGKDILRLLYTVEYERAYITTLILLLGSQGMVIYKIFSRYFASQNSFRILYISLSLAVISNVVFNFFLIPVYGINGAAFSSFFSYWICGLFIAYKANVSFLKLFNFIDLFNLLKSKIQ